MRGDKGQALVEMAFVLPILILLLLGIFEFGRAFNAYLTLQHSTREGVRRGVTGATDQEIVDRIRQTAAALDWSQVEVHITPPEGERRSGMELNVSTVYTFRFVVPVVSSWSEGIRLQTSLKMRME
ncbi:MAG: TadE family protein [Bacillota bacterium]